jgi:hypothetical protein
VKHTHEPVIGAWASTQIVGGGPIEVYGLSRPSGAGDDEGVRRCLALADTETSGVTAD